jgi:type IV pilus assembly protein PilQ
MKTFRRLLLIGLFAAAGTGLAVLVADQTNSSSVSEQTSSSWSTATSTPEGPPRTEACISMPPRHVAGMEPARKDSDEGRRDPRLVLAVPHGPLGAEYAPPPRAVLSQAGNVSADNLLEYLQQQLGQSSAPPLPPKTGVNPPPSPAMGNLPGPAGSAKPSASGSVAKAPKPVVKADPEGDGKLTIHIQNSDLREVLDLLSEQGGLNILAGKEVQGKVSATLTGVDIQSALDAILRSTGYVARRQGPYIFVGTPDEFNSMEQALDRVATRVYRPNYVTATELKTLIQPLLTEKIGVVSVSSPAEAGIATNSSVAGGDKYAGGDVVLVRDYQAVLLQIDQMVAEVDVRPLQVSIEAMILSVKLDDTDTFGVDFALLRDHLRFGWGTPLSTLDKFPFKGGLKVGYLDGNIAAFLEALQQVAATNVVAKPHLMVLNKHRAEILIGDKKGYISTTVTETASTQTVDFLEVGAQLRLRPFISRDGLVRMEIHPELSDGSVDVKDGMTLPNKSVTEVTSNIMVRDGCTVVIGGLIKDQQTTAIAGIPVLASLPWVGPIFRNTKETKERHEVVVLITPRIVYEPGTCREGERAACEFERRHAVYGEKMSPLGRRHIALRYMRLAQSARTQGDLDTALRFAEMAVHFDPSGREAIELRSQVWQAKTGGTAEGPSADTATVPQAGVPTLAGPALIDGPNIAPWVLDELRRESPPVQLHPLDPGQPGTHKELVRPRKLEP